MKKIEVEYRKSLLLIALTIVLNILFCVNGILTNHLNIAIFFGLLTFVSFGMALITYFIQRKIRGISSIAKKMLDEFSLDIKK